MTSRGISRNVGHSSRRIWHLCSEIKPELTDRQRCVWLSYAYLGTWGLWLLTGGGGRSCSGGSDSPGGGAVLAAWHHRHGEANAEVVVSLEVTLSTAKRCHCLRSPDRICFTYYVRRRWAVVWVLFFFYCIIFFFCTKMQFVHLFTRLTSGH